MRAKLPVIEALPEAGERVRAIARLHESLRASSNLKQVSFGAYLRQLAEQFRIVHVCDDTAFEIETNDVVLDMETALPLGLIADELIVNSLKHAFPSERAGRVRAAIEHVQDSISQTRHQTKHPFSFRAEATVSARFPTLFQGKQAAWDC